MFLFIDALYTFYLRLYGVNHMLKDNSDSEREKRCRHMGYSFRLASSVLLYASSHRENNKYHGLSYTSRGVLAQQLVLFILSCLWDGAYKTFLGAIRKDLTAVGFLSNYLNSPLPYAQRYITVNTNVLSASLNKIFPSRFL